MYFIKSLIKPSTLLEYKLKNRIACDSNHELSTMLLKFDNFHKNEKACQKLKLKVYNDYFLAYYLQTNKGISN